MNKAIQRIAGLWIEISGMCNANCPYCARQRFNQRHSGNNMPAALFKRILDYLSGIGLLSNDCISTVHLYNWGEPFLNPEINDILRILKEKQLYAGISSNFIVKPEIDKEFLSILGEVIFSLSGLTQETYGRIHGAPISKVLNNFNYFYERIQNNASNTKISIYWHRYRFNETELWEAYRYFDRPGIRFRPKIAFLNDLLEFLSFIDGGLSGARKIQAERDLLINHINRSLSYHRKRSKHYWCPMWHHLVVDENGQLLLCCNVTNNDAGYLLGNILEMSAEEIMNNKLSASICNICISSGLARTLCNPINNHPFPAGGGRDYLKLLYQLNLSGGFRGDLYSNLVRMAKDLPEGERIVRIIKGLR